MVAFRSPGLSWMESRDRYEAHVGAGAFKGAIRVGADIEVGAEARAVQRIGFGQADVAGSSARVLNTTGVGRAVTVVVARGGAV